MTMGPEHHLLADDALMALDWARTRLDVALGAGLTCGAGPIFIGRGLMEKGEHVHDWAAEVDDPVTRSKSSPATAFSTCPAADLGMVDTGVRRSRPQETDRSRGVRSATSFRRAGCCSSIHSER